MKIERPDWKKEIWKDLGSWRPLNVWFDQHVEPINKMLSEGVEITCHRNSFTSQDSWYATKNLYEATHKALLINIEPIKKDTTDDVLREFIRLYQKGNYTTMSDIYHRALTILEKK